MLLEKIGNSILQRLWVLLGDGDAEEHEVRGDVQGRRDLSDGVEVAVGGLDQHRCVDLRALEVVGVDIRQASCIFRLQKQLIHFMGCLGLELLLECLQTGAKMHC